jgi:phytoene dehydrogenase-like protein
MSRDVDAIVVGSGPNGLAAAIEIARTGRSVQVIEAAATVGGGVRSDELTLPGFIHDVCSGIHPFGRTSAFFRSVDLARHGLRWVEPDAPLGHPLDDGTAVMAEREVDATAAGLGADGPAYRRLIGPLVANWNRLADDLLAPFHVPLRPPRAIRMARFGWFAIQSATAVARRFEGDRARALFAGAAAHSIIRLTEPISAASALVMLASAHADGWPFPAGGSGQLSDAMAAEVRRLGGTIEAGRTVDRIDALPAAGAILFDLTARQVLEVAGDRFPSGYRRRLERFRYGAGVFKVDIAIEGEIPWRAADLRRAGTVHLGGSFEEIARSEAAVFAGDVSERPFVLLAQQSLFDRSRAPEGRNAVWAYCHVPNGWSGDATDRIIRQIERFAPGFRERILKIASWGPPEYEAYNANNVGGDIAGGRIDLSQLFSRPSLRIFDPYSTPDPRIFICSASTPPAGGVHGASGMHGARSALRRLG